MNITAPSRQSTVAAVTRSGSKASYLPCPGRFLMFRRPPSREAAADVPSNRPEYDPHAFNPSHGNRRSVLHWKAVAAA
jgi:hypothetical protein